MSRIRLKIAFSLIAILTTSIRCFFPTSKKYSAAKEKFFAIKNFPEFTHQFELAWL